VVRALGRFGFELLGAAPRAEDDVRAERVVPPMLQATFRGDASGDLAGTYELRIDGESFRVAVAGGEVGIERGPAADPVLALSAHTETLVALVQRRLTAAEALVEGLVEVQGPQAAFERFVEAFAAAERPVVA